MMESMHELNMETVVNDRRFLSLNNITTIDQNVSIAISRALALPKRCNQAHGIVIKRATMIKSRVHNGLMNIAIMIASDVLRKHHA